MIKSEGQFQKLEECDQENVNQTVMIPHGSLNPQSRLPAPTEAIYEENSGEVQAAITEEGDIRLGSWRDGICDCLNNLWPSCGCTFFFLGVWLISQIAHKTGLGKFQQLIIGFASAFIFFSFSSIFVPVYPRLLLYIVVVGYSVYLRHHIVSKYRIATSSRFIDVYFYGICCFPCSVAQMARHVYRYHYIFDGDSRIDAGQKYSAATV